MHRLECDVWVPAKLDQVWNFASKPENLAKISPQNFSLKVKSGETANDSRVNLEVSPLGLPLPFKWVSLISEVIATGSRRQFVDVQESGPFAHWKHRHHFDEGISEFQGSRSEHKIKSHSAGTWIRDRVEYEIPYGILGAAAHTIILRKTLEDMFAYRRQKLWELFGVAEPAKT